MSNRAPAPRRDQNDPRVRQHRSETNTRPSRLELPSTVDESHYQLSDTGLAPSTPFEDMNGTSQRTRSEVMNSVQLYPSNGRQTRSNVSGSQAAALNKQCLMDAHLGAHNDSFIVPRVFLAMELEVSTFVNSELDGEAGDLWNMVVVVGRENYRWAGSVGEYVLGRWPEASESIRSLFHMFAEGEIIGKPKSTKFNVSASSQSHPPGETERSSAEESISSVLRMELGRRITQSDIAANEVDFVEYNKAWSINILPDDQLVISAISVGKYGSGGHGIILAIDGDLQLRANMVESIGWLIGVLQNSANGPFDCNVSLERSLVAGELLYSFRVYNMGDVDASELGRCWVPLVPCTPCTTNFLTRYRPDALFGIELSFELLCILCGINYEIEHDGGLVMYGDRAMVYPVFLHMDLVQWHLLPCDPGGSPHIDLTGRFLRGWDLEDLRHHKTHILGMWSDPEVTLGCESSEYGKLAFSAATQISSVTIKDSYTIGGTIQLPRFISLSATVTYKVAKSRKNNYMNGRLPDDLFARVNSPVLLYSPSEKRAWLVSYVSVVLHLARCRAFLRAEFNYHIPPCSRAADGGRAAWTCIKACYGDNLIKVEENEVLSVEEQNVKVEHHIREVMACVDRAKREANSAKGYFRDSIIGYELAAIAKYRETMVLKTDKLEWLTDGWGPILDEVELVFFYKGVPDPIVPSSKSKHAWKQNGACGAAMWSTIPQNFMLLTASLPCLLHMAEVHGDRNGYIRKITNSHTWHCPTSTANIFAFCKARKTCKCNRLQELQRVQSQNYIPSIKLSGDNLGAVVFRYAKRWEEIVPLVPKAKHCLSSSSTSTGDFGADRVSVYNNSDIDFGLASPPITDTATSETYDEDDIADLNSSLQKLRSSEREMTTEDSNSVFHAPKINLSQPLENQASQSSTTGSRQPIVRTKSPRLKTRATKRLADERKIGKPTNKKTSKLDSVARWMS